MKIINELSHFYSEENTALAIGKFDGLHRGHEYLLEVLHKKKAEGLLSAVFTFKTPPLRAEKKVLTTNLEKEELFDSAGIDLVVECEFTQEIREMEPLTFLKMLKEHLRVNCIAAGWDCAFGRDRTGNVETLRRYEKELSYQAVIVDKMQYEGKDISSTMIRDYVTKGDMETANHLLGYPYFISGETAHGNRIGHEIGIPTINVIPAAEKLLPPNGVYVSESIVAGKKYRGITNIGIKPTIPGERTVSMETHLFDFDRETYDEDVRTELLSFIRPEKSFSDLAALTAQIENDIEKAKSFFS